MFLPSKNETEKTIFLIRVCIFLRTDIDSTDFKNENLTKK